MVDFDAYLISLWMLMISEVPAIVRQKGLDVAELLIRGETESYTDMFFRRDKHIRKEPFMMLIFPGLTGLIFMTCQYLVQHIAAFMINICLQKMKQWPVSQREIIKYLKNMWLVFLN